MKHLLSSFLLAFTFAIVTFGQLTINSEFRTRFELRQGYREMVPDASTPAGLVWQRTRISLVYESNNFKLKLTPQDSRLWGDETQRSSSGVFGDEASLELFEGYAELKLGALGWVAVGRQALNYDNQRLLSARNWNNSGLSYDAVLFKLKVSTWNIHLASTWNSLIEASSDNYYPTNRIKNLNFLWVNRDLGKTATLSILQLSTGTTESDTSNTLHYKHTSGGYTTYTLDKFRGWAEAYYQYGNTKTGMDVRAFLIAADAACKTKYITPGAGFNYLSGNSKVGAEQKTEKLFDILYGARHRFYGGMDYFRNFESHTLQGGLVDYYFYLDFKLNKALSFKNTGHYFQLAQTNANTPSTKNLGYENDLVIKYKFNAWGTLELGHLFMIPEKSLETMQGVANSGVQQFAYIQLIVAPTLYENVKPNNN